MLRVIIFFLAFGLTASVACSKNSGGPDQPSPKAGMLDLIPADSPFVMVSTEKLPRPFTDWLLSSLMPLSEVMQKEVTRLKQQATDPLGQAILAEVDGKLNRAGLESMGITLEARFAVYMIGPSLAVRFELADGATFAGMLDRIEQNSGRAATKGQLGAITYREMVENDVAMVLAIIDNELVFGLMNANARPAVLPVLFGEQPPAQTLASAGTVAQLMSKYQLMGVSVGYFDSHAAVRMLTGKASPLTTAIMAASKVELPQFSATCQDEFRQIADAVPRFAFGYQELAEKRARSMAALELRPDLAKEMVALQAPRLDLTRLAKERSLFAMGLNMDLGKSLEWLRQTLQSRQASPFQCEYLGDVNQAVAEVSREMGSPLPPFVMNFKGIAAAVYDVQLGGFVPTGSGYATLSMDNVMTMVEFGKSMIPQLSGIDLKPDGKPVAVPIGMPGLDRVDVVANDNALGVAAGAGMVTKANALMNAQPAANTPAMAVAYDYAKILALMDQGGGAYRPRREALFQSLASLLGFYAAEASFTNDGMVTTMTFTAE
ncbi:MAG: hypothetical protein AAGC55_17540 [Myxococcota bacterium]